MNSENSRDFILETACKLFSQKGYDAIGVQEICNAAGITKPTLYYYFGSKNGLLTAIIQEKGEKLFENLETAAEYNHDFFNSLTKILKTEIAYAKNNQDYFKLHINLIHSPADSESALCYSPLKTKIHNLIVDFFKKSAAEFGNMAAKEELYATLFQNNLISVAENVLNGVIDDSEDSIYKIIHSFIYGFAD